MRSAAADFAGGFRMLSQHDEGRVNLMLRTPCESGGARFRKLNFELVVGMKFDLALVVFWTEGEHGISVARRLRYRNVLAGAARNVATLAEQN